MEASFVHSLRRPALVTLLTSVSVIAALATQALPVSATTPVFRFRVSLDSGCVSGYSPANDSLTVKLSSADGSLVGAIPVTANSSGNWYSACFERNVQPHDIVSAVDSTHHRSFTVPAVTGYLSRTTDVTSGVAPAGSTLNTYLEDCSQLECVYRGARAVHVNAHGNWQTDWTSTANVRGNSYVDVDWADTQQDDVSITAYSPFVLVIVGSAQPTGFLGIGRTAQIRLMRQATLLGTANVVGPPGSVQYTGVFLSARSVPVPVGRGDTIRTTFGPSFKVGNLSVTVHPATNTVTGVCPPHRAFEVYAHDVTAPYRSNDYSYAYGTSSATGHVTADMTDGYPLFDLLPNDQVVLYCATPDGDQQSVRSIVP